jgi:hypothetical protein
MLPPKNQSLIPSASIRRLGHHPGDEASVDHEVQLALCPPCCCAEATIFLGRGADGACSADRYSPPSSAVPYCWAWSPEDGFVAVNWSPRGGLFVAKIVSMTSFSLLVARSVNSPTIALNAATP